MTGIRHIHRAGRIGRFLLALLLLGGGMPLAAHAADEPAGPVYVNLDPVDFSIFGSNGQVRLEVSIQLALELKPGITQAMLRLYQPKIEDRVLPTLDTLWESAPPNAVISTEQIKQVLMPAITDVTGKDKILQILVLSVSEVRG